MIMTEFEYKTKNYNGNVAFFFLFIIVIFGVVFSIYLLKLLDTPPLLGVILSMSILVSPLFFKQKIMAFYTKNTTIRLIDESIVILYYGMDEKNILKEKRYPLILLKSYNFDFGGSRPQLTALNLHFKKGLPKTFNFIDKEFKDSKSFTEMLKNECFVTFFYSYVKQYNINKEEDDKIKMVPGFFATKTGTIIIYCIAVLIIIAIVLHLIIAPKSSFATLLISISLVASFFSKRKKLIEINNKVMETVDGNAK
jgi:hypothetical protein